MDETCDEPEARYVRFGRAYAAALLTADEVEAELAIRDALAAKLTIAEIDEQIIAPALWLIGDLWQRGEITIAHEHLATEISTRMLALQREAQRVAHARAGYRVMLATPSGEHHVIALRMVGELLREAGCQVVMLGPDVPSDALAAAARAHAPHAVVLSSTIPGGADQLMIAIHEVQREFPTTGFVIGGRAVTSRLRSLPGIGVCERVSDAVEAVDAIVHHAEHN
jgi:methanogenic corrinoid protein MtbC1